MLFLNPTKTPTPSQEAAMSSDRSFLIVAGVIVSAAILIRSEPASGWSLLIVLVIVLGAMGRHIRRG